MSDPTYEPIERVYVLYDPIADKYLSFGVWLDAEFCMTFPSYEYAESYVAHNGKIIPKYVCIERFYLNKNAEK